MTSTNRRSTISKVVDNKQACGALIEDNRDGGGGRASSLESLLQLLVD